MVELSLVKNAKEEKVEVLRVLHGARDLENISPLFDEEVSVYGLVYIERDRLMVAILRIL